MPLLVLLLLALAHPKDGPDADLRLRVEGSEVRLDLFLNLVYVDELVDAPRAAEARLDAAEQSVLRAALFERLAARVRVEADGRALAPRAEGFAFFPADEDALALFPVYGARAAARVRVDLAWPFEGRPEELAFTWDAFVPDLAREGAPPVELRALLELGGAERVVELSADSPRVAWRPGEARGDGALLEVPAPPAERTLPGLSLLIALLLVGALGFAFGSARGRPLRRAALLSAPFVIAAAVSARGLWPVPLPGGSAAPDAAQARAVFEPLLANVYRAFELRGEEEVYDALARGVEGELLEELYLDVRRSLVLEEAGGAVARVQDVTLRELTVEPEAADPRGFALRARWRVRAAVHHWGHTHERVNEELARFQLRATEGAWRIASCEVLALERVDAPPTEQPPDGVVPR